ncbi:MAG: MazG nucleotide pyrophosphohydrolase domain-containing protein [Nanoarchaeota archaeon]
MTTIKDAQTWTKEAWKQSDKALTDNDMYLFLMEEIGEMAEAIRKMKGNKANKPFTPDLEKELGDILLSLLTIAVRYDIDLEKAFEKTKNQFMIAMQGPRVRQV